jgi:hypothetical protein
MGKFLEPGEATEAPRGAKCKASCEGLCSVPHKFQEGHTVLYSRRWGKSIFLDSSGKVVDVLRSLFGSTSISTTILIESVRPKYRLLSSGCYLGI